MRWQMKRKYRRRSRHRSQNCIKAQKVIIDTAENKKLRQRFAEIAVWHYERAAAKYREAVARFEEVAKMCLRTKYREHFDKKAKEVASRTAQAATAKNVINEILNQKEN